MGLKFKEFEMLYPNDPNIPKPPDPILCGKILENNDSFTFWRDKESHEIIIRCINKPSNLLPFGITFVEHTQQVIDKLAGDK